MPPEPSSSARRPEGETAYKPVVLVCRSVGERHELWGLTGKGTARFFRMEGTATRPQDFRNHAPRRTDGDHA